MVDIRNNLFVLNSTLLHRALSRILDVSKFSRFRNLSNQLGESSVDRRDSHFCKSLTYVERKCAR